MEREFSEIEKEYLAAYDKLEALCEGVQILQDALDLGVVEIVVVDGGEEHFISFLPQNYYPLDTKVSFVELRKNSDGYTQAVFAYDGIHEPTTWDGAMADLRQETMRAQGRMN